MSDNRNTRAARTYHEGTKHPGGPLLNPRHRYGPGDRPTALYKKYRNVETVELPLEASPTRASTLEVITTHTYSPDDSRHPDLAALAQLLHYSAGITKTLRGIDFRAAATTGALYHIELYVVCADLPHLPAGVYHYDVHDEQLSRLRSGDYRQALVDATGNEPAVAHAPAVLLYTDVFWRNAVKYQARAYRHAFWDSGTILANSLAMAAAHDLPARLVMGFVDETVNALLALDTDREVTLALLPVGHMEEPNILPSPPVEPLSLDVLDVSQLHPPQAHILDVHRASMLTTPRAVSDWRSGSWGYLLPQPDDEKLHSLEPLDNLPADPPAEVIQRRGSTRQFAREALSLHQLSTVLQSTTRGLPADFLPEPGERLNDIYLLVNAVHGLPSGAYVYHPDRGALELLRAGQLRREAGALGLGQRLAADASVNVYFLTNLDRVLEHYGNRGYRAAQIDASATAGRMYLAAYALRLGATGLTFYDDAAVDLFSPHAAGKGVTFLILLGHPAY